MVRNRSGKGATRAWRNGEAFRVGLSVEDERAREVPHLFDKVMQRGLSFAFRRWYGADRGKEKDERRDGRAGSGRVKRSACTHTLNEDSDD